MSLVSLSRSGVIYRTVRTMRNRATRRAKRLEGVHPTASIHARAKVAKDLLAAEYVFVGHGCEVGPGVSIGRYSMLAPQVVVVGDDHRWDIVAVPMQFAGRPVQQPTAIGADVWIGYGVTVLRGTSIGRGSIVAAGAVVAADVPAYQVWGGVPARRIRDRFATEHERDQHDAMLTGPLVAPEFTAPQRMEV